MALWLYVYDFSNFWIQTYCGLSKCPWANQPPNAQGGLSRASFRCPDTSITDGMFTDSCTLMVVHWADGKKSYFTSLVMNKGFFFSGSYLHILERSGSGLDPCNKNNFLGWKRLRHHPGCFQHRWTHPRWANHPSANYKVRQTGEALWSLARRRLKCQVEGRQMEEFAASCLSCLHHRYTGRSTKVRGICQNMIYGHHWQRSHSEWIILSAPQT